MAPLGHCKAAVTQWKKCLLSLHHMPGTLCLLTWWIWERGPWASALMNWLIVWQRLLATSNLNVVSPGTLTSTCMKLQPLGACSPHCMLGDTGTERRLQWSVVPQGTSGSAQSRLQCFDRIVSLRWESLHSVQPSSQEGYRGWIGLYWLNICNRKHLKPNSTFWFADTYALDSVVRGESGNDEAALP